MSERIELTTKDGIRIIGDCYPAAGARGILLLHMMPSTRKSWRSFAEKLRTAGFQVLAIDLRGHGESQGGPDGYKNFSDVEHQTSIQDVDAAAEFLKSKNTKKLYLAGASIGANLALWYLADHEEARAAILLSPGLDYWGVVTEPYASRLKPNQSIYYIGDEENMRSSGASAAEMAERLYELTSVKKNIKILKGSGHGTDILSKNPWLEDELVEWLQGV